MTERKEWPEIVDVHPELAAFWLTLNLDGNRPIDSHRVAALTETMLAGEWILTGQGITFDSEGHLVDAQHRLTAVVRSNVTIPMLVLWEADPKSFEVIDRGRARAVGHTLQRNGIANGSAVAAAARVVIGIENEWRTIRGGFTLEPRHVHAVVQKHPLLPSIARISKNTCTRSNGFPLLPAGVSAGLLSIAEKVGVGLVEEWVGPLRTGENLSSTDSRLLLRRYAMNETSRKDGIMHAALVIKAWNAHRAGRTVNQMRWRQDEPFPVAHP